MGDEKAGCGACITLFIAVVGAFLLAKSFDSVSRRSRNPCLRQCIQRPCNTAAPPTAERDRAEEGHTQQHVRPQHGPRLRLPESQSWNSQVTPEKIGINFNSFKKEIEETKARTRLAACATTP